MKIFAFYLPQFHEIPENDEWWGKGFTEWYNVKNAKPLFRGHIQPKHPLDNNYYNLLDKKTIEWQTNLMHKYHVNGMIYYHYYFKGKLLLEKPAENLLKDKNINQPFFFCWANHDWKKTWNGSQEMLMKLEYGDEEDWEKHFQYLLPFFRDIRYEKRMNMPLFMIFNSNFKEKENMFQYFDKRCKDYGFNGIYLIETFSLDQHDSIEYGINKFKKQLSSVSKKIFFREYSTANSIYYHTRKTDLIQKSIRKLSSVTFRILGKPKYVYRLSGDKLYEIMINEEPYGSDYIHGCFFEWDNTPRHKRNGVVVNPVSKKLFFEFMNKAKDDDYVFVNAWNEWAEGMVLEPTEEEGYKYLNWIKEWVESDQC